MTKNFLKILFEFQLQLKLFHWNTKRYARHKATDKLMTALLEFIDVFVEAYLGKFNSIAQPKQICLQTDITDKNLCSKLFNPFLKFLKEWKGTFKNDTEFSNLIEELEAKVERTKYLLRLQ